MGKLLPNQNKNLKTMNANIKNLAIGAFVCSSLFVATSCQKDTSSSASQQYASILNVAADGQSDVVTNNLKSVLVLTPTFTSSEMDILLKAKDEEKLALDVYTTLYAKWGSQIFSNISRAEQTHLNAIITLLTDNGSADSALASVGMFSDPATKTLYDNLIIQGNLSLEEALKVGAAIEELDIRDLTLYASQTTNSNITLVFENLLKGSRNHLRAFNRQLTILGIIYTPQYLDVTSFQAIVTASMEKGKQYKMNNGQRKGGNKGKGNGGDGTGTGTGTGTGICVN